jgi:hypothetical protein
MSQRVLPFPVLALSRRPAGAARRPAGRRSPLLRSCRSAFVGLIALGSVSSLGAAAAFAGEAPDPVGRPRQAPPSAPPAPVPVRGGRRALAAAPGRTIGLRTASVEPSAGARARAMAFAGPNRAAGGSPGAARRRCGAPGARRQLRSLGRCPLRGTREDPGGARQGDRGQGRREGVGGARGARDAGWHVRGHPRPDRGGREGTGEARGGFLGCAGAPQRQGRGAPDGRPEGRRPDGGCLPGGRRSVRAEEAHPCARGGGRRGWRGGQGEARRWGRRRREDGLPRRGRGGRRARHALDSRAR